jgi:hypothetical protein
MQNTYLVDVNEWIQDPKGLSTEKMFPGKAPLKLIFGKENIVVTGGHCAPNFRMVFSTQQIHSIE